MYPKRQAEQELDGILSGTKVGIVLGARQVGKTTLVEQLLRERRAVFPNLDVEVDKARFKAAADLSPADALRSFGSPRVLVIDEAQRLPEVSRIVKGWHDTRLPVNDLQDQAAESLTGRNRKPILPPLLFSEALQSQAKAARYARYSSGTSGSETPC
jgi:predicted AAA+ superfamily ATPase